MSATVLPQVMRRHAALSAAAWPVNLLLAAITGLTLAGLALVVAADEAVGWSGYESADAAVFLALFPVLPITGAMLARRRPRNPIGWLFLTAALCLALTAFAHGYADYGLYARPGSLPGAAEVAWGAWTSWIAFVLLVVFVPLLYPTGRLPSRRWRPVAAAAAFATGTVALALTLDPGPFPNYPDTANPFGVAGLADPLDAIEFAAGAVLLLAMAGALASLVIRYRGADPMQRRQLRWLAWTAGLLILADLVVNVLLGGGIDDHVTRCAFGSAAAEPVYGTVLPVLLVAGLPASVGVAVLRHDLYGLNRFIRRSAVYATLWAGIALVFVAVAWTLGVTATGRVPVAVSVGLTIAATMAFAPARAGLERAADRWVFGRRASGLELASGLGADLDASGDLHELARSSAQLAHRGLGVDWARVVFTAAAAHASATAGTREEDEPAAVTVPVRHGDIELGRIECGRSANPRRERENRRLLELLAHEAGLSVHSIALAASLAEQNRTVDAQAAELQASRGRILAAQESERRRLERDLHDGAQQELVAIIVKLRIAADRAEDSGTAAALRDVQQDAKAALGGIRALAQGIHPSVLGDEGLVAAVAARAARLPVQVELDTDEATRSARFADPIEGAAYFVVGEAVANALKHAEAGQVRIRIRIRRDTLVVEVVDDGRGFEPADARGSGLLALADRVAGLGGRLHVRSATGAGTCVRAELPATPRT